MKEKTYTLEQIKSSFFKTFNESGEWFFPDDNDCEDSQKATERIFAEFKEELDSCEDKIGFTCDKDENGRLRPYFSVDGKDPLVGAVI